MWIQGQKSPDTTLTGFGEGGLLWARSPIYFHPHSPATINHTGPLHAGLSRHWEGEVLDRGNMAGLVPWYPKELWELGDGALGGQRSYAEVYVQAGGTGTEGRQPCTQEQYDPSLWWPWRAWRLQVGKAAGMEIPEEEARTGGGLGESLHSWQLSGLRAGQGG